MYMKTIESLSAEAWDKRRVNVHHLVGECLYHLLVEYGHEAGIYYQVSLFFNERIGNSLCIGSYISILLTRDNAAFDAVLRSSFKSVYAFL